MREIRLDPSKLYGFRILPEDALRQHGRTDTAQAAKLGAKVGEKGRGPAHGSKLGAKVGGKQV